MIDLWVLQDNNALQLANVTMDTKTTHITVRKKRSHITNLQFFIDDHFADRAVHHRRRQIKHFSQRIQTTNKDDKIIKTWISQWNNIYKNIIT